MEKYVVLIADIEDSRKMKGPEREEVQKKLSALLEKLSCDGTALVSPYTITLGDEFQAVYRTADGICGHILRILTELYPVTVRFSLAAGTITTPINREQAIGMDGPAFHAARRGIELLKENGFLFHLDVEDADEQLLGLVNGSLKLLSREIRTWNENRLHISYLLKEGYDYREIAERLDISNTAFYKNKRAGMLDVVEGLGTNMASVINRNLEV